MQGYPMYPFFVYGTLLPGQPNAFLWQGFEVRAEKAHLDNGRLHDMGGYPMLVEGRAGSVKGQLITIKRDFYEVVLNRLDFLEGFDPLRPHASGYRRVVREVVGENGRTAAAWVYLGRAELVNGRATIPHGNWIAYLRQQNQGLSSSSSGKYPINPPDF